jgi:hypothetical protein
MKFAGVLLLTFLSALWVQAHSLQAIKGTKALLILDETPVAIDDILLVLDSSGAEQGQVQVHQIKDKRAIAIITQGTLPMPPTSYKLEPASKSPNAPVITPPVKPDLTPTAVTVPQAKGYYGGVSQNQLSVSLTNSTTLKLSGLSFNAGAFYERALTRRLQVLARAGYEGLKAKGSLSSDACGASCDVDVSYLAADALVKYSFYNGKKTWWLGGGLGFLFPLVKSSNVLDTSKMTLNEKIILGGGLNWYLNTTNFIPVQLEYALQPSNSIVTTSQFILRVGYGARF